MTHEGPAPSPEVVELKQLQAQAIALAVIGLTGCGKVEKKDEKELRDRREKRELNCLSFSDIFRVCICRTEDCERCHGGAKAGRRGGGAQGGLLFSAKYFPI